MILGPFEKNHVFLAKLVWEMRRGVSRQNCEWGIYPHFCVGPNAFRGMGKSPKRHSENFTAFFQGGFLLRRLSKL
jgi:hypothetical protein